MHKGIIAVAALALAAALSACGGRGTYADGARFHSNQPINRGALHVAPADPTMGNSLEFRTHAETVATERRRLGFRTVPDRAQAQYVATLDIIQTDGAPITRPGVTVGMPWEGRASKTAIAGMQEAMLAWAGPALAGALFRDFPGTPGVTRQVRL